MNCFMGYNPLVAKEVKITTWIKEFDGDSPVYPSFPNEGDCFVVFATDEDALTHNALSKKTYTNGDWADAEGGGGGDSDFTTASVTITNSKGADIAIQGCFATDEDDFHISNFTVGVDASSEVVATIILYKGQTYLYTGNYTVTISGDIEDDGDGYYVVTGDCAITITA